MIEHAYSELFAQDSVSKQMLIETDDKSVTITNDMLYLENFQLTESICSQNQLTFGSCEASVVKFRVANVAEPIIGQWITVKEMLNGDTLTPFQFGRYKVTGDQPTADRKYRDVTAYDALYEVLSADVAAWYNSLTFPMTLKAFRNAFFHHFGIEQEDIALVNDNMTVEKTISITASSSDGSTIGEALSGKMVLACICEINGCFGHMGRNGKFAYLYLSQGKSGLYPSQTLYPKEDLYPRQPKGFRISKSTYKKCTYEDFLVQKIDKLQIRKEENDIGVVVGSGSNTYVIEDNFLVYGKGTEELTGIANNIYGKISGITYRPFQAETRGNPCLEVGDAVRLSTRYELVESFILQRTIKGIQALNDSYSADGEEYRTGQVNSIQKSILELKGKTNTLTRTVEETRLEIADVEQNLQTQITVNANGLTSKVSKDSIVSEINQSAESVVIKAAKIDLQGIVSATEFTSKYATIDSLNAQKARIDSIAANYISASSVAANYATIESLKATNLAVSGKLEATQFTAENISAMNITVKSANVTGGFNASKITSGTISADRLNVSDIAAHFSSAIDLTVGAMRAQSVNSVTANISSGISILGHTCSWKSATVNGTTINYLGY